jgi:hypothetical protein
LAQGGDGGDASIQVARSSNNALNVSGAVVGWAINNREPVFQLGFAVVLFCRVLIEARALFPFEICGLVIRDEWLSFSIKPDDGYQLPKITRRMMEHSFTMN